MDDSLPNDRSFELRQCPRILEKTEIIPIGTVTHRTEIVETRKIHHADQAPLDAKIHIAKDGEAVRSLGAWIGNNTQDLTPWESVIDKIIRKLDLWRSEEHTSELQSPC